MAYTKYSLTPADNNAAPPNGAPEGMLPSAVNDTMRDMMSQIRDVGDGIRGGTYTMTAPVITGGSITGVALSGNTLTNPVITGGSINNTPIGASTANTGAFTTLGASGVATFSAGTVSAPAITTTGDTNTGIFFPAADTIAFTEGGVESMRITSAGNLGLGITPGAWGTTFSQKAIQISPVASISSLDAGSGNVQTNIGCNAVDFVSTPVYISSAPASAYRQTAGNHRWFNASSGTAGNPITFTEAMILNTTGNLGIGTVSPASRLDVQGQSIVRDTTTTTTRLELTPSSDVPRVEFLNSGTYTMGIGYRGASAATIQNIGEINVFANSPLALYTNNTERMRIDSSGNIGIGTTTPGGRLTVSGTPTSTSFGNRLTFNLRNTNTSGNQSCQIALGSAGSSVGAVFISSDAAADGTQTGVGTFGATDILRFVTTATERMRIDSSGNLGLGVTPSAWGSSYKAIEAGGAGSVFMGSNIAIVSSNLFNNGSNWIRKNAQAGSLLYQGTDSSFQFYQTGSGSAGSTATLTQAMTLDASGNLQLGTTTAVTSNGTNLNIYGASASNLSLQNATSGTGNNNGFQLIQDGVITYLQNRENGAMTFATNNTERMRIDSSGNLLVGTTTAGGRFNVSGITNTTSTSGIASSNNAGLKSLTGVAASTLTTVATLTKPAGNSPMRRVVFTVSSTNDGSDTGYAVACSVREVLFSNYGGSTHILKSTELSNNIGSINAGVVSVALTTAAALSGTSVLLQATATITGSASSGLTARLMTKVEIISDSIYQDITFA